jgi:hypothetical protein
MKCLFWVKYWGLVFSDAETAATPLRDFLFLDQRIDSSKQREHIDKNVIIYSKRLITRLLLGQRKFCLLISEGF